MFAARISESSHFGTDNSTKITPVRKVPAVSDKASGQVRHHPSGMMSQSAALLFPVFILGVIVGLGMIKDASAQTTGTGAGAQPSSLSEIYSDWKVSCQKMGPKTENKPHVCQMMHKLQNRKSGKLIMAVVLPGNPGKDGVNALIIAPFGLNLAEGIVVSVGEANAEAKSAGLTAKIQARAPFHTCLPSGCVARFNLNRNMISALRKGNVAQVKMVSADQNKSVKVNISLKGFTAAERRLKALATNFD